MKLSAAVAASILAFASAQDCNNCPATATITVTATETSTQTITETVFPSSSLVAPVSSSVGIPHYPGRPHSYPAYSSSSVGAYQTGWYSTGVWSSIVAPVSTSAIGYPGYGSSSYVVSSSLDGAISSSYYPSASASVSLPPYPNHVYSSSVFPVGTGVWSSSASYSFPSSFSGFPSSSLVAAVSVSSAPVPSSSSLPACWTACFAKAGNPTEPELCGNNKVQDCICNTCDETDDKAYKLWVASYCAALSSSLAGAISSSFYPSSSSAWSYPISSSVDGAISSSYYPSVVPSSSLAGAISSSYVASSSGWAFPSSSSLAGAISSSYYPSSVASSLPPYPYPSSSGSAYPVGTGTGVWGSSASWSFPTGYSSFPSSSLAGAISSSYFPSSASWTYPSSSSLAGAISSSAYAYPSSSSSYLGSIVLPASSSSAAPIPSSSLLPSCWTECFGEAGITSESELCGNTVVDKCIHDTCPPTEVMGYWSWYNNYCGVSSSSSFYPAPSSSSLAGAISGSAFPSSSYYSLPPYPTPSGSSVGAFSTGWPYPTGGYSSSFSYSYGPSSSLDGAISASSVPVPSSSFAWPAYSSAPAPVYSKRHARDIAAN